MKKICSKCKEEKELTEFIKCLRGTFRVHSYCKSCFSKYQKEWRQNNPEKAKEISRNFHKNHKEERLASNRLYHKNNNRQYKKHHISKEWLIKEYEKGCFSCGSKEDLTIDHDHTCCPSYSGSCGKCIRGVLCRKCNFALGLLKDNKNTLSNLIKYLENYEERIRSSNKSIQ